MAIEPIGRTSARETISLAPDPVSPMDGGSALGQLVNQPSSLDRLVADAGALGKFREDQPNAMPSGTSSFTVPITQTIAHVETRMGQPNERVLGATQTLQPRAIPPAERLADPHHLGLRAAEVRPQEVAPRPDVRTDADNRVAAFVHGNPSAAGA